MATVDFEREKDFPKMSQKKGLKILSLNINGISGKFGIFNLFLEDLKNQKVSPDIIFISETKLRAIKFPTKFNLLHYKAFHSPRISGRGGGGILMYVHENLRVNQKTQIVNVFEIQFLIVKLLDIDISICGVYRPPTSIFSPLDSFYDEYDLILSKHKKLISVGDFNIDLLRDESLLIEEVLDLNNACILNKVDREFSTRVCKNGDNQISSSIIDHVHTNLQNNHSFCLHIGCNYLSDHNFLLLTVKDVIETKTCSAINKNLTNYTNVSRKLKKLLKDENYSKFDDFHKDLTDIIKSETVCVSINKKFNNKWFNNCLRSLWKEKVKYSKLKYKYPLNTFYAERLKLISKKLVIDIKEAKKKYFSKLLSEHKNNAKKTWEILNDIIGNSKKFKTRSFIKLKIEDEVIEDPVTVINRLNEFFIECGANTSTHKLTHEFEDFQTPNETLEKFSNVNEEEVLRIISSLKNVSMGDDNVPASFLKTNAALLVPIITKFINRAFSEGKFPECLKSARITVLFKSGDSENPSNYRPISLLSIFSKIFETCIKNQLIEHLNTNNIINTRQYGFLAKSSTTAAASCLINDLYCSLNNKKKTALLALDISKAFDCVNHSILNITLSKIGVLDIAKKLIINYLSNRTQCIVKDGIRSQLLTVINGCAQGSILGPLIFLIYINGFLQIKLNGKVRLYADDAAIVYSASNNDNLQQQMIEDLINIESFLSSINLRLNINKTNFMILSLSYAKNQVFNKITFNNNSIVSVQSMKYLGVIIDNNLNWNLHAKNVLKNITPYISVLYTLRHYVEKKSLMMYYYAHIHSRLTYCLPVWQNINNLCRDAIQRAQNKAIKAINFLPPLTPTKDLYDNTFLSFSNHIKYENILFIYKVYMGLTKCDLKLIKNYEITNRTTRQSRNLRVPDFISTRAQSSIFYHGLVMFNSFRTYLSKKNVSLLTNINVIKAEIKRFITS